jgi:hypothetical protein
MGRLVPPRTSVLLLLVVALCFAPAGSASASTTVSAPWKNCTQVHTRYPHGVGRLTARDKTSGAPVRSFKRSTRLYLIAIGQNRGLDRDHDGIACEAL